MALATPTKPLTRANVEAYLDKGELCAQMGNGRWWRIRRNGKTQTWKRDATRFRIPIKAGLKAYGDISDDNVYGGFIDPSHVRHVDDIPAHLHT